MHLKHGTYEYWKGRSLAYERILKSMIATPVDTAQLSVFTEVQKFPVKRKGKNFRITQVYGSLTGQQILEKRVEIEKEEQIKKTKLKERADKAERMKNDFKLCETECTCDQNYCIVKGFKKCSVCENVLKSLCSIAMCKIASNGKPNMITPAVDRTNKAMRIALMKEKIKMKVCSSRFVRQFLLQSKKVISLGNGSVLTMTAH